MASTPKEPTAHAEFDEALRRQVVELQRVSSLGVLAGSVCHELNNALTPILSYAKLGLRNPDPEFRRKAFEKILDGAQRAAAITGGVLGLARPQSDVRAPADLVRLTEEILLLAGKDLQKGRVKVEFRAEGRPHARVNPAQIQQVLLNLMINARQAMPDGGLLRLGVGTDPSGRWAEIRVADTGAGIAPADLRRIFEPFFTTKVGPDSSGQGGTGLGLSVCRDIVESHKGRLRAESRPGQGTAFTLRLPSCAAPRRRRARREASARLTGRVGGAIIASGRPRVPAPATVNDVTQLLSALAEGEAGAADRLLPLVYDELRQLAARKMAHEKPGQTLQATGLVHEAYLRLVGQGPGEGWDGRRHFFAAAAEAMRRILVENARRKKRLRHGGAGHRVDLHDADLAVEAPRDDLIAVDEALDRLAKVDPQAAELVKFRYFVGMTTDEAAEALGLSPRTAYRAWSFARAWLFRHLSRGEPTTSD